MTVLEGKGVCGGYAFGSILFYQKSDSAVKRVAVEHSEQELARFDSAQQQAIEQLKALYDKAMVEVGEANAQIFDIHQMMLEDDDYLESIRHIITTQQTNAEFAVATTADNFTGMFASMDDPYMQGRAADIRDVSERVIRILSGLSTDAAQFSDPVILAAEDLAPSETVQLDKEKILAFATLRGSANSHTAILARMMNIPAVIGLKGQLSPEDDGKIAIVDGFTGKVYVEPDAATAAEFREKAKAEAEKQEKLAQLAGKENVTLDGQHIDLFANISGAGDVAYALQNDAGGIGLFRSEFLYLQADDYPSEEAQFQAYKSVAETMAGRKVIIRTMDIGADKKIDYFDLASEENPALGFRGKIPLWAFAPSASVWSARRSSNPSSAPCTAPAPMEISASCSP